MSHVPRCHGDGPELCAGFSALTHPGSNSMGLPCVRADGTAPSQGCWLPQGLIRFASLGRLDIGGRKGHSSFCRGHPSWEHLPPRVTQTPTTHQPEPQLSCVSMKSNQQRDGFAVPSGCLGGDGLGITEKKEIL